MKWAPALPLGPLCLLVMYAEGLWHVGAFNQSASLCLGRVWHNPGPAMF